MGRHSRISRFLPRKVLIMRVFLFFTILISCFSMSSQSMANQCNQVSGAFDRYQIIGSDLQVGDVLTFWVDYSNDSFVIDESNKSADICARDVSLVCQRTSLTACRAGDPNLSPQYTPVFDATANIVDTIHDNVVVQLKLNGQDFTSALVSETAPAITMGILPHYQCGRKDWGPLLKAILSIFPMSHRLMSMFVWISSPMMVHPILNLPKAVLILILSTISLAIQPYLLVLIWRHRIPDTLLSWHEAHASKVLVTSVGPVLNALMHH